jgi:hypothetical protein
VASHGVPHLASRLGHSSGHVRSTGSGAVVPPTEASGQRSAHSLSRFVKSCPPDGLGTVRELRGMYRLTGERTAVNNDERDRN